MSALFIRNFVNNCGAFAPFFTHHHRKLLLNAESFFEASVKRALLADFDYSGGPMLTKDVHYDVERLCSSVRATSVRSKPERGCGQLSRGRHSRWTYDFTLQQMPLHVYIEDGTGTPGYRDSYPDLIRRAFNEWQNVSNSTLSWKEVGSPEDADIVCSWTAEARPKGNGVEAGQTKTTIARNPLFGGGRIVSAHVMVLTYLFGHAFSTSDIYKTCLHEIGHALGMQGHSSTVGDIMYPVLNPNQTPYLKARDRNTITALYAQNDGRDSIASRNYGQLIARRRFINSGNDPIYGFSSPWQQMQMPSSNGYAGGWMFAPMPMR